MTSPEPTTSAAEGGTSTPAYLILMRKMVDPELAERYLAGSGPVTQAFGGEYLVRGAVPTVLEGRSYSDGYGAVIVKFPSSERASEFYHSKEYAPWREMAQQAFERHMIMVDGLTP